MSGRWPIVVAMLAAVACSSAAAPYREYEIRFDAPAPYRQFGDDFRARLNSLGRPTPPAGVGSPAASPPASSR